MEPLDGNAIAGELVAVFGTEMTAATCECGVCAARFALAQAEVYLRAPGTVMRCRSCGGILMVLVTIRGVTCVDLRGLALIELGS
jgi:hypothetical protein